MTTTTPTPVVIDARRESGCGFLFCDSRIYVGQRICRSPGKRAMHIACWEKDQARQAQATPTPPVPPKRTGQVSLGKQYARSEGRCVSCAAPIGVGQPYKALSNGQGDQHWHCMARTKREQARLWELRCAADNSRDGVDAELPESSPRQPQV